MAVAVLAAERLISTEHLEAAIRGDGLRTVFQPVVDLNRRTIAGYEALTRFDDVDGRHFGPDDWFTAAARDSLTARLDARTLAGALARRVDLPRNCFLSVNIEPCSLATAPVMDLLRSQGSLAGLVIELTEHRPWMWDDLEVAVTELRSRGAVFAMDDAGAGYSGLRQILQLRPSIVKLDRSIVHDIDTDEAKRSLVETLGSFTSRIDAWILAEGVETAAEAQTLLDLEVPLVQGFYFGRPSPPWGPMDPASLIELRQLPRTGRTTLHRLVDPAPARRQSDTLRQSDTECGGTTRDWSAVVDDDQRPVGLHHRRAADGGMIQSLIANVHASPIEIAQRLATAPESDPCAPVIVVDNGGRYLGLVSIRRLLRALST